MQKLRLDHALTQRLSPQKIQLIKLLQIPSVAIKDRIEQELTNNPALEECSHKPEELPHSEENREEDWNEIRSSDDSYPYSKAVYKQRQEQSAAREYRISTTDTLGEKLLEQLSLLKLNQQQRKIGAYLIGSIGVDGYIRQESETIVNELAFMQYIETNVQEVEELLKKIQNFDPPGVGARDLQECLLIQLKKIRKHDATSQLARKVLVQCFEEFSKKHHEKIIEKLAIAHPQLLKDALALIARLDPKPGSNFDMSSESQVLYPDFIVTKQNNQLHVALSHYSTPALRTRNSYTTMLNRYRKSEKKDKKLQEVITFVKKKLEAAQWFIDAVQQRQHTLLNTMKAIVNFQKDFFMEEEERKLKPMILKYIAQEIGLDISTVSRIVNNKSVQTDFGVYPLKYFFTEAITTDSGENVSNRAVKKAISEMIKTESKQKPYTDHKIARLLKSQGYLVARRTVAKYREQLQIPVARLRKSI